MGEVKSREGIEAIAFTDKGEALANKLMKEVGGLVTRSSRHNNVNHWTTEKFDSLEALVYVGAMGIAVRAIAPHIEHKDVDPAVIVIDESGKYVIPILSGHLGGANELAAVLAGVCGAQLVITTATDIRGVFAVDLWGKKQDCVMLETDRIKDVSGKLLAGKNITLRTSWPIKGTTPGGIIITKADDADVSLDIKADESKALHVVPKICTLGVGCRRGTSAAALEHFLNRLLLDSGISEAAIKQVASIDIKAEEPGLKEFCKNHGWELVTYSAFELEQVKGKFSSSDFVKDTTGVDNVCERSAVLASGGELIEEKMAGDGITMAIAVADFSPTWRS